MANKPSRETRRLARERSVRAKQRDLPTASLPAPPSRLRGGASTVGDTGGSGRCRRDQESGGDQTTDADSPSAPASSAPRPNLWRRLPAGAKLGIILALALAIAGAIMGALRRGSAGTTEQAKPVSDARAVETATDAASTPSAATPAAAPSADGVVSSADSVPGPDVD